MIPIYKICVCDERKEPIMRFYNDPYGMKLLYDVIPKKSIRLEKSSQNNLYRIAVYIELFHEDAALKMAELLEEAYSHYKKAYGY